MTTQTAPDTTCAYVGTYNCDCGAPLDAREDMTNRPYGITTCTRSGEVVLSGPATRTARARTTATIRHHADAIKSLATTLADEANTLDIYRDPTAIANLIATITYINTRTELLADLIADLT